MYLADVDIVCKISACDIVDEAIQAIGASWDTFYILPSTKYTLNVCKKIEKGQEKFGAAVHSRICEFVNRAKEIDWEPGGWISTLSSVTGMDSGEAILFSVAQQRESSIVVTGDKKCLRALTGDRRCNTIAPKFERRVVCFEQLILACISRHGFDCIRTKIGPEITCDRSLVNAFGADLSATEIETVERLRKSVKVLTRSMGPHNLLVDSLA
jgi:hypothetical protein